MLLMSNGKDTRKGIEKRRRNFTDEPWEKKQERDRERSCNFTDEQREREHESKKERRKNFT